MIDSDRLERMFEDELEGAPGGVGLLSALKRDAVSVISSLDQADPGALSDQQLVEQIGSWDRLVRWAQGRQVALISELTERSSDTADWVQVDPEVISGEEVAAVLALSSREGVNRARVAASLSSVLWETHEALLAGQIDYAKASLIAAELRDHTPQVAFAVEDVILPFASRCSKAQLKSRIAKALVEIDPVDADIRFTRAYAKRRVNRPRVLADGMASIYMVLAADDALAIDACANAAARSRKADGDVRTMDQLRADSILAMAHHALAMGGIGIENESESSELELVETAGRPAGVAVFRNHWQFADCEGAARETWGRKIDAVSVDGTPGIGPCGANLVGTQSLGAHEETANGAWAIRFPTCFKGWREDLKGLTPTLSAYFCQEASAEVFRWGRTLRAASSLSVTVPFDALLDQAGVAELNWPQLLAPGAENLADQPRADVAVLEGYGAIAPVLASRIALDANAVWRRIVTDPLSGAVLDVGRASYRPPPDLARHVAARDGYCVSPRCQVKAANCDLDHTVPFAGAGAGAGDGIGAGTGAGATSGGGDGIGRTSADNLGPLCRRHHRLKTLAGWELVQTSPGRFRWRSPSGRVERSAGEGPLLDGD